jgi:hypothetical protein
MERKYRTQKHRNILYSYITDDIYVTAVFSIIILLNLFLIMK